MCYEDVVVDIGKRIDIDDLAGHCYARRRRRMWKDCGVGHGAATAGAVLEGWNKKRKNGTRAN